MALITIDIDNTWADFEKAWRTRHFIECDCHTDGEWTLEGPDPVYDTLHTQAGFATREEFWHWVREGGVFADVNPYYMAHRVVRNWDEAGHQVIWVTRRPWWAASDTRIMFNRWLGTSFPIYHDCGRGRNDSRILWLARTLGRIPDIHIDDQRESHSAESLTRVYYRDQPWNRDPIPLAGVSVDNSQGRFHSWLEVPDLIVP